jgi:hypothetical protein
VLEHADPVAEHHRRHRDQHLVELADLDALAGDVGAEHVDVALPRRRARGGDRRREVVEEEDVGRLVGRRIVGEDELRAAPGAAEGALLVGAAVRVVAAPGVVADQERADPRDQLAADPVRPQPVQPLHVAAGAGDEAVERGRRRVEELRHPQPSIRPRRRSSSARSTSFAVSDAARW